MDSGAVWVWVLTISLAELFWIYFGYPLSLLFIRRPNGNPVDVAEAELPFVSVIVPTRNEHLSIERKLRNLESLRYPKEKFEVLVVDGESTDETPSIVRGYTPLVQLLELPRIGKALSISRALPQTRGEIIVVTDANAEMSPDALRQVVTLFRNPRIGAATGAMRQHDLSGTAVSEGGDLYWRVETFIRTREAWLHSVVGVSGEMAAFRRSLLVRPDGSIEDWYIPGTADDLQLSLWVIGHGFRVGYAPNAEVWEVAPDTTQDLFGQKVRIITQTIVSVRRSLGTALRSGWYGYTFFSRKVLPLLSPWALLALAVSSAILAVAGNVLAISFIVIQGIAYMLAIVGLNRRVHFRLARTAAFFLLLNITVFVGWVHAVLGRDYTRWDPVQSTRMAAKRP